MYHSEFFMHNRKLCFSWLCSRCSQHMINLDLSSSSSSLIDVMRSSNVVDHGQDAFSGVDAFFFKHNFLVVDVFSKHESCCIIVR